MPWAEEHVRFLGVTPTLIELLAVFGLDAAPALDLLPIWRTAAGPFGPVVHHRLAQLVVAPNAALRTEAAGMVVDLAAQGRLDAALLAEGCVDLAGRGEFSLGRAAAAFEQAILAGAAAAVWPSISGVLQLACTRPGAKSAGLADLLRVAGRYVAAAVRHQPRQPCRLEFARWPRRRARARLRPRRVRTCARGRRGERRRRRRRRERESA